MVWSLLLTKFIVYGNLFIFPRHLFRQHTAAIVFLLDRFKKKKKK